MEISYEFLIEKIFDQILLKIGKELFEPLAMICYEEERDLEEKKNFEEIFEDFLERGMVAVLAEDLSRELEGCNLEVLADKCMKRPSLIQQLSSGLLEEVRFLN